MTLKDKIVSIVNSKRNTNGLTAAQVHARLTKSDAFYWTAYSTTRARLYELSDSGEVFRQIGEVPSKFFPAVAQPVTSNW